MCIKKILLVNLYSWSFGKKTINLLFNPGEAHEKPGLPSYPGCFRARFVGDENFLPSYIGIIS